MEEQVTTGGIILNVVIQIANLAVFFFAFKYFLGDKITKALSEREQLIKRLKHADHEYQEILDKAKVEADKILAKAKKHADTILHEGEALAQQRSKVILEEGEYKAKAVLSQAAKEAKKLEDQLTSSWTESLKSTSKLLVKKILGSDEKLQEKYLDGLVKELEK